MGTTGIGAGAACAHLRRRIGKPCLEQPSESAAGQLDHLDRPTSCNESLRFSIMFGAQAACAEHRATRSSASGGSARTQFLPCVERACPFSVHAGHATRRARGGRASAARRSLGGSGRALTAESGSSASISTREAAEGSAIWAASWAAWEHFVPRVRSQ